MKMKAVVSSESGKPFEIQEVELEEPRSTEILVRITATGVCHTDLFFKDSMPLPMPAIFGHEGAGIVEKVGNAVTTVAPGDSVVLSYNSCGVCRYCLSGMPYSCENSYMANYSGARMDGSMPASQNGTALFSSFFGQSSFAEYCLANEQNTVKVSTDVPLELLGPLGCGIMTGAGTIVNVLGAKPGEAIAVFGTGAVGISAIMMANTIGCHHIIGVDINPQRLELAKEFGATHVVNSGEQNPVEQIQALTGGGADYTIETTAIPAVYRQAFDSLHMVGQCILLGVSAIGAEVSLDMQQILLGRTTRGVVEGNSIPQLFVPQLIDLYKRGRFPFDKLIKVYEMADFNQAVEDSEKGVTIKPVVKFNS